MKTRLLSTLPAHSSKPSWRSFRPAVSVFVIAAIVSLCLPVFGSIPITDHATAFINLEGFATINGSRAVQGQTLLPGGKVSTEQKSELIANLDNGARLKLEAKTNLLVSFSKSTVSGSIEGTMQGSVPAGIAAQFQTPDATVSNDSSERAEFTITTAECSTKLFVRAGHVTVRNSGKTATLNAGESSTTDNANQSASQFLSKKKKVGLLIVIGAAVAIIFAAATGGSDPTPALDFGGCVTAPSGGTPTSCP
jgi:hypothetical protein